ncbi:TIGR03943 family putative permease subunit [Metabacillus arenae]|uniref:TIGR03943 family protein n=1 Tax=Metabacillus arenae TaxID=2771434 RepID=A0A926RXK6_9BACI|nr:TIGR03943 family protein [Metabacillus arenae]MBD1380237.1 TIGR03943 family protein [Metabacillus arenae]
MQKTPDYRFHLYIRGIILLGFTMLMFKLLITGNITNFIAPKMIPFIYFAVITFLILGVIQIWRSGSKKESEIVCNCGFDHSDGSSPIQSLIIYSLFVIPVVTGFIFPETVLDSSVAAKRGFKTGLTQEQSQSSPDKEEQASPDDEELAELYLEDPDEYMKKLEERVEKKGEEEANAENIPLEHPEGFIIQDPPEGFYEELEQKMLKMDKIVLTEDNYIAMTNILDQNPEKFIGKEIEFFGFVYREDNFKEDEFVVARFGLSCCVADASVYGTLTTFAQASEYETDEWVKVSGKLTKTDYEDFVLPYVQIENIERIEQPKEPYVYEVYE